MGEICGDWSSVLDEDAMDALGKLEPHVAEAIIAELQAKGSSVHNPSAYVVRAMNNAKLGNLPPRLGSGSSSGAMQDMQQNAFEFPTPEHSALVEQLDEKAQEALSQVDPAAAEDILRMLLNKGDTVKNPSAYVVQSVGNEKKRRGFAGGGVGGASMGNPEK